jgi:enoyl-CoA hydratase/carnithine racemase
MAAFITIDYRVVGRVATVTMTRPNQLNSITDLFIDDMNEVLDTVGADRRIRTLVIRGSEKVFSVGMDLALLDRGFADIEAFRSSLRRIHQLFLRIEEADLPVVAVVEGLTRAGGLELLLACDLVIVSTSARIADNHTPFGVIPGGGSTVRLPRKVGHQQARRLIYTGAWLVGEDAVTAGLALTAVAPEAIDVELDRLLAALVDKPRATLGAAKRAMNRGAALSVEGAIAVELEEFEALLESPDSVAREGFAAYREGRSPLWE